MKSLWLIAPLLTCSLPSFAQSIVPTNPPANVTLAWNASAETNMGPLSYTIFYGPASAAYTNSVPAGTNLTVTVSNLVRGSTCYFAVIATATNGLVSPPSNEVSYRPPLPPPPPTVFRVIVGP